MRGFHGSSEKFDRFNTELVCLAEDDEIARQYIDRWGMEDDEPGYLYTVDVDINIPLTEIAWEDEVRQVAEEIGVDMYDPFYEDVEENPRLVQALRAEGYKAIQFDGDSTLSGTEHETLMILDANLVTIRDRKKVIPWEGC